MTTTILPMDTKAMDAGRQEQSRIWQQLRERQARPTYDNSRQPTTNGQQHLMQERRRRGL